MDRVAACFGALVALAFSCGGGQRGAPATPPASPAAPQDAAPASSPAPIVEVPDGYVPMHVMAVGPTGDGGAAVVLTDDAKERLLPLAIGGTEAASISLRHTGEKFARPLTHDLFDAVMAKVGVELVQVRIDDLREGVFIGSIFVRSGARIHQIDARPSDAIALAIGRGLPIYVAEPVLTAGGIKASDLPTEAPEEMPPPPDLPPKGP